MSLHSFVRILTLPLLAMSCAVYAMDDENEETPLQTKLSQGISTFTFSLYSQVSASSTDSFVYSPYSLYSCLSLTYLGAREDTAAQMAKALNLPFAGKELGTAFSKLSSSLIAKKQQNAYEIKLANALWLNRDSYVLSDFRHLAQTDFDAKVESLTFSDTEKSSSIINEWTSNQTDGKIVNLVQQADLSSSTRLFLTNALYFKGSWVNPFDPKATQPSPFMTTSGSSISMPLMEQTSLFSYFENELCQMIALPFIGSNDQRASMHCVIFLPKATSSLSALESALTDITLLQWLSSLEKRTIHLKLPSFELKPRLEMNPFLQQLGMQQAFTPSANFAGIDGMKDLFVSKVLHESFFHLDENGVVAAAASGAAMSLKSTGPSQEIPIEFIANRPFLFGLIDLSTHTVLFFGKFSGPKIETAQ